jgi:hypothetical protein
MMRVAKAFPLLLSSAFLMLALGALGCERKEGPAEKAGKELDQGLEKAGEQMEEAGDKIKDKTN